MIIREYLSLQKKFQQEYGDRTVLLYQIGTFYEIYGYNPLQCSNEEAKRDKRDKSGIIWNEAMGYAEETQYRSKLCSQLRKQQ